MNELDYIAAAEGRSGWFIDLGWTGSAWSCTLQPGVEVMKSKHPKPHGVGRTALEAVKAAQLERDTRKAVA